MQTAHSKQAVAPAPVPALLPAPVEGSRGVILRESLILFAERGYGATTVRDIGERAGMLSGSLYSHFASKEAILAELVQMGMAEHHKCLRNAILSSASDPRNQLFALMREHVRFHTLYATLAMVTHAELHILSQAKAERAQTLRSQSQQLVRDVIERGVALHVFDVPDIDVALAAVSSMGVRVAYWYTPAFHLDAAMLSEQMAELACRVVGAPAAVTAE
jgi:AcrR family transcriptional regulator